ncbi:alanyl-tRNA ligase [Salinisphaera sp. PC39]|uniref:alanine--tRNA ligase n=1 Tax=Salinisphaera sp. PC39 TaxID=1304156 RepID=UPI00333FD81A
MTGTNALRSQFLEFFAERGHRVVASSPLVPGNDPTLLFTNAGMVPFKDVFLGREKRDYTRAASAQRCVRAGGKHNDLENVGYTARHHTFFEMLGNFSFGDYFKREAIAYAWEFLTGTLGLPPEKLWVTVYEEDDEAADIWLEEIGVSAERFSRIGAHDNFWSMGDTGPCGPCSEIFYDHGPEIAGGPPGTPEEDGDRYVEIWNLVFMQYNRTADGEMEPLPSPSVDTGMGLERIAAVMQGTHDNYGIDVFRRLIAAAAEATGHADDGDSSLKVIADHIRATAFLIVDGVLPANEGRGYVLRRIMRRAIRHGHKLGARGAFFHKLVAPLVDEMGAAYPELRDAAAHVERVIGQEEARFEETLNQGMRILEDAIAGLDGDTLPGEVVFKLYDTYGFPADLTNDVARERGLKIDEAGFEREMAAQRERARAASRFEVDYNVKAPAAGETRFTGYDATADEGRVMALMRDGETVERLREGESGVVVLDVTPFYAESGGQVGDTGVLTGAGGRFLVEDTQKTDGQHLHFGRVEAGELGTGERMEAQVDAIRRVAVELNHTGTHLVHAALREILGTHVRQKGSLVAPDRLRFDFAHYETVTPDLLADIEKRVNEQVRADIEGEFYYRSYDDAIAEGALAFFGEKYGDTVRVVRYGDYSVELCGGTHVARSGEIGLFKLTEERGVAAGVRRIEAVTGEAALAGVQAGEARVRRLAERLRAAPVELEDKLDKLIERNAALEKQVDQLGRKMASAQGGDLAARAVTVAGVPVLAERLDGADRKTLRDTVDQLKNKLGSGVVVLGAEEDDGKVALIAGVTKDLTDRVRAGDLVNFVAGKVGGRGGGRPDMAQAGGSEPAQLDAALSGVRDWVADVLGETAGTAASNS